MNCNVLKLPNGRCIGGVPMRIPRVVAAGVLLCVAACGGGGSAPASYYAVGGTVAGLQGGGLVLLNNGGDNLNVSASSTTFTFATKVASGNPFNVTVMTQPSNPSQACVVAHASGTVTGNDITNVAVTCTTNNYTLSGTVSGLSGSGLVIGYCADRLESDQSASRLQCREWHRSRGRGERQ
jgi:hypothetical protein